MSEQFLKFTEETALILENAGDAFDFEDRKCVQHIIITVSHSSERTKNSFNDSLSAEACRVVAGLL